MSKGLETFLWFCIFFFVFVLWNGFGGLAAAMGNSPDKFQALGVLFSAWAFVGLFFTIYQQGKSGKAQLKEATELRKEASLFAEATKRYTEIEEFKQGLSVLDTVRNHHQLMAEGFAKVKKSDLPQINERTQDVIDGLLKSVERYDKIRKVMMQEFENKYFAKYDKQIDYPAPDLDKIFDELVATDSMRRTPAAPPARSDS